MAEACTVSRFTMFEGNTRILNFEVKDSNDDPVTIDDALATIFAMFGGDSLEEALRLDLDGGITLAGNIVTVVIPAASSLSVGEYLYELQLTDASSYIHTLAQGSATVKRKYIQ